MREILFRGKRKDTKQWIEGGYVKWSDIRDEKHYQIVSSNGHYNDIDPTTLGQFSNKLDANKQEVFQGDILYLRREDATEDEGYYEIFYEVIYKDGAFGLINLADSKKEFLPFCIYPIDEEEIIGNIHDKEERE